MQWDHQPVYQPMPVAASAPGRWRSSVSERPALRCVVRTIHPNRTAAWNHHRPRLKAPVRNGRRIDRRAFGEKAPRPLPPDSAGVVEDQRKPFQSVARKRTVKSAAPEAKACASCASMPGESVCPTGPTMQRPRRATAKTKKIPFVRLLRGFLNSARSQSSIFRGFDGG